MIILFECYSKKSKICKRKEDTNNMIPTSLAILIDKNFSIFYFSIFQYFFFFHSCTWKGSKKLTKTLHIKAKTITQNIRRFII